MTRCTHLLACRILGLGGVHWDGDLIAEDLLAPQFGRQQMVGTLTTLPPSPTPVRQSPLSCAREPAPPVRMRARASASNGPALLRTSGSAPVILVGRHRAGGAISAQEVTLAFEVVGAIMRS